MANVTTWPVNDRTQMGASMTERFHRGRGDRLDPSLWPRWALWSMVAALAPGLSLADTTTTLDGQFGTGQENGCMHISAFYYRVDCGYTSQRKPLNTTGPQWPWVGPTSNSAYYARDRREARPDYTPAVGDLRQPPWTTARVTVDTGATSAVTDDLISAEFLVGPGARNLATRIEAGTGRPLRVVESWSELRHTLAPTQASSATPNAAGGIDYVIGAKGFPAQLCRRGAPTDCFPSARAVLLRSGAQGEHTWEQASPVSIARGRFIGDNAGATTVAVFNGYRCEDSAGGNECRTSPMVWGGRSKPGFDNLVLRVTTDGSGRVMDLQGYWTQEFHLAGGPARLAVAATEPNSWLGGFLDLTQRTSFSGAAH